MKKEPQLSKVTTSLINQKNKKKRRSKEEKERDDIIKSLDMTSEAFDLDDDHFMIKTHVCVYEKCSMSQNFTQIFKFLERKYKLIMQEKKSDFLKKHPNREQAIDNITR